MAAEGLSAALNGRIVLPSELDNQEDDYFVKDYPVSASEDEVDSDDERKHRKLLEAISSLDGKKRRKLAERTEASLQVSEFSVSSEGAGEKIHLSDLLKPIKSSSSLANVKKQLHKIKTKKTVELPLTKQETQRIQREVAYEKASKDITKWDRVVLQNRKAEQLVFPLNQERVAVKPIEEVLTNWKARTPLEQEIFNILHKNKQPLTDPLLTPVEEASLKAMSLEEAKLRREELQKARALQSYYESKARRERKIKSKKYHRVLKKGKRKDALKEFEEFRKTNPEAALEELQKMEKTRIVERMSLKHQNSGKWAKTKVLMGKYDLEARKAMQEQLEKNKELTKKIEIVSDSEDEVEPEEDTVPDFVNEVQMTKEGPNPWMLGRLTSDAIDSGAQEGIKDPLPAMEEMRKQEQEEEKELSEEEALLLEFEDRRRLRKEQEYQAEEPEEAEMGCNREIASDIGEEKVAEYNSLFQRLIEQGKRSQGKQGSEEHPGTSVDSAVSCSQGRKEQENMDEQASVRDEGPILMESLERKQSLEDVGNLGREEWGEDEEVSRVLPEEEVQQSTDHSKEEQKKKKKKKKKMMIDPNAVLTVQSHVIRASALPTAVEEEEEDEGDQKMIIQEAFAGDDVIDDFLKDKRNAEKAGKPKDIDLTLPGWGEWGGTGLKPSKKKRKRFIIKATPGPPRKDRHLPNVIINEKRDITVAAHQVNELPFPFNNRQQFEGSIRTPIGTAWNTQRAFQKLTAPRVLTKQGHIIEPISEEDAFQKSNTSQKVKPAFELNPNKSQAKQARRKQPRTQKQKAAL